MSKYVEGDGDGGSLVEPEGVNAGRPVDHEAGPAGGEVADGEASDRDPVDRRDRPDRPGEGQGKGELLSRAGSENGLTRPGPGQEFSAEEG